MDIDWIFFDWGGTLAQVATQVDRLRTGARRAAEILAPGRPECAATLIERILGAEAAAASDPELREADVHTCLREWAAAVGAAGDSQLATAAAALGESWIGSLELMPGVLEALDVLRGRGYRTGLVSNCMVPPAYCHRELARLELAGRLDFVVFSSEVGYRKPSAKIYRRALDLALGAGHEPPYSRVLFVGDSPEFDVIAPAALGMKTALVTCRRGIWPREAYERARPDLRVDSVAELPALLAR